MINHSYFCELGIFHVARLFRAKPKEEYFGRVFVNYKTTDGVDQEIVEGSSTVRNLKAKFYTP